MTAPGRMNLCIDIGNTHTKAQRFEGGEPKGLSQTVATGAEGLAEVLSGAEGCRVAVSSVVRLGEGMMGMLRDAHALVVTGHTPVPLQVAYRTPATLGADRLCAAVGASAMFPGRAVLAIDLGTCLTYDLVSAKGEYLGGAIAPGLRMRFRALADHTSQLPHLSPGRLSDALGTDTESSIRCGVQQGLLAEVIAAIGIHSNAHPGLVAVGTGGDLAFFGEALKSRIFAAPLLVLSGLDEILRFNS